MLIIGLDREESEYMVRGLVMSFFPHQEFGVDLTPAGELTVEQKKERLQVEHNRVTYYDAEGKEYSADYVRPSEAGGKVDSAGLESDEAAEAPQMTEKIPIEDCRALERAVFEVLGRATHISLPWGILTGVRPTKLPMAMLRDGMEDAAIRERLETEFRISPEKAATATDIARRELKLLNEIDYKNGYSLYIGIPFCPTICLYCSFSAYPL
ncbi:MAG: coproporphyrinogen dehydrogenase HemZ, partial [Lachnospiraceae bacterium]|nr:coproporphyrinogen dehydrogenase HemZ [Lachnospiraceae bacterium]